MCLFQCKFLSPGGGGFKRGGASNRAWLISDDSAVFKNENYSLKGNKTCSEGSSVHFLTVLFLTRSGFISMWSTWFVTRGVFKTVKCYFLILLRIHKSYRAWEHDFMMQGLIGGEPVLIQLSSRVFIQTDIRLWYYSCCNLSNSTSGSHAKPKNENVLGSKDSVLL